MMTCEQMTLRLKCSRASVEAWPVVKAGSRGVTIGCVRCCASAQPATELAIPAPTRPRPPLASSRSGWIGSAVRSRSSSTSSVRPERRSLRTRCILRKEGAWPPDRRVPEQASLLSPSRRFDGVISADELVLSVHATRGRRQPVELARQSDRDFAELEADAIARPDAIVNPVDLGTILVPAGWLLLGPGQSATLEVAAISRTRDLPRCAG